MLAIGCTPAIPSVRRARGGRGDPAASSDNGGEPDDGSRWIVLTVDTQVPEVEELRQLVELGHERGYLVIGEVASADRKSTRLNSSH